MCRSFQPTFHLLVVVLCTILTYSRYQLILLHDEENNYLGAGNSGNYNLKSPVKLSVDSEEHLAPFKSQISLGIVYIDEIVTHTYWVITSFCLVIPKYCAYCFYLKENTELMEINLIIT